MIFHSNRQVSIQRYGSYLQQPKFLYYQLYTCITSKCIYLSSKNYYYHPLCWSNVPQYPYYYPYTHYSKHSYYNTNNPVSCMSHLASSWWCYLLWIKNLECHTSRTPKVKGDIVRWHCQVQGRRWQWQTKGYIWYTYD